MITTFIDNFREKHGFNKHTAMLPYDDEGDSEEGTYTLGGRAQNGDTQEDNLPTRFLHPGRR